MAVGDGQAELSPQGPLMVGGLVIAVQGDGGGVVVQLVEIDGELADRVGHDGEGERGDVGVEESVEAAADAVVVERRELGGDQPQPLRGVSGRPLAEAVEGLARDQEVLEQDHQPGGGGYAGPPVFGREVIAEEGLEAEPAEDDLEDRQRGETAGGQGPDGGACGPTAGVSWIGIVVRSPRLVPHGGIPRTPLSASESGGRSAAISADMVVRGWGRSRKKILTKFLRRYALTQVGRPSI